MLRFIILSTFIFTGLSFAEKNINKKPMKQDSKKESKNLLNEAIKDSDEEIDSNTKEKAPTLLESVSNTEKAKKLIQRELAKTFNFELGTPSNKAIKTDEDKKAISFGDVDLQISERPEEVLVKKEPPKRNKNNTLTIKAKPDRAISSKHKSH